jgi:hypothetical protein
MVATALLVIVTAKRDRVRACHDERERLSPRAVDVPARATPIAPA